MCPVGEPNQATCILGDLNSVAEDVHSYLHLGRCSRMGPVPPVEKPNVDPQDTIVLIVGALQRAPLILGNPHVCARVLAPACGEADGVASFGVVSWTLQQHVVVSQNKGT